MAVVLSVIGAVVVVAYLLLKFVQSSSSLASYRELQANWTLARQRVDTLRATYGENVREQYYSVAVVEESHNNSDGSSRQQIISTLEEGEPVLILRELSNEYDRHAIAVYVERDGWPRQIGYLSRKDARLHAQMIDAGKAYRAEVRHIVGGTSDEPSRGVWLDLYRMEPPVNEKSRVGKEEKGCRDTDGQPSLQLKQSRTVDTTS